jgi:hypothetical protein
MLWACRSDRRPRTRIPHQTRRSSRCCRTQIFGDGLMYYLVQASAVLILVLAANTALHPDFRAGVAAGPRRLVPRSSLHSVASAWLHERILTLGSWALLILVRRDRSPAAVVRGGRFTAFTCRRRHGNTGDDWGADGGSKPSALPAGTGRSSSRRDGFHGFVVADRTRLPMVGAHAGDRAALHLGVTEIVPLPRSGPRHGPPGATPMGENPCATWWWCRGAPESARPSGAALAQALSGDVTAVRGDRPEAKERRMPGPVGRGIPLTIVESPYGTSRATGVPVEAQAATNAPRRSPSSYPDTSPTASGGSCSTARRRSSKLSLLFTPGSS